MICTVRSSCDIIIHFGSIDKCEMVYCVFSYLGHGPYIHVRSNLAKCKFILVFVCVGRLVASYPEVLREARIVATLVHVQDKKL